MRTRAQVDMAILNTVSWRDAFQFGDATDTTWSFTGATFHADIKDNKDNASVLLSLTDGNGRIVVDDLVLRVLHFNVTTADIVANLPPAAYAYDLVMIQGGVRTALMGGHVCVRQGVTRS